MKHFSESVVEEAAFAWLETVGRRPLRGAEIAPGELQVKEAERATMETTV